MTAKPAASAAKVPVCEGSPERIVAAAAGLFGEQGFEGVSMNEIAERAGTSKANVFHHFGSKRDLYLAVMRRACHESGEALRQLACDSEQLPEQLRHFVRVHLRNMLEHGEVTRLVLRELVDRGQPSELQRLASQAFAENFSLLVGLLRDGQRRGVLRHEVDPAMVALLLVGANVFFFQCQHSLDSYPEISFACTPDRYHDLLIDIIMNGIRPR